MDYLKLYREISLDPTSKGYAAMTDAKVASAINANTEQIARTSITSVELWENTALAEYKLLGVAERQTYDVLVSLNSIDVSPGTNSRAALSALFPVGSVTRDNLIALVTTPILTSRAAILGLGMVYAGHVYKARIQGGNKWQHKR